MYEENAKAVAFFREHVQPGDIVVTHHVPSQRCIAPRFVGSPLNPFFVCDLTGLILKSQPRLWLHGHTHSSAAEQIGATMVLCNPFGYAVVKPNPEFKNRLVVDI